tara:strand:- start:1449 stop:1718 length:270 start_codon:yes stop_codon:yes gene_type:complete
MDNDLEYFDLFNLEHQDNILDIYYDVIDYCDNVGINIDKRSYGKFFELIFNNSNIENSSEIIRSLIKLENNELMMDSSDKELDDYDDYY